MNEELNDDLPQVDELTSLKTRADMMGISYHPSIGLEKLREKIKTVLESEGPVDPGKDDEDAPVQATTKPVEETLHQKRSRLKREAEKLVRIRVTCMNPAKREWEGEIFTSGNSLVGTQKKFVPFNTDDGWHVPHIIYKQIKQRKCLIFVTRKTKDGRVDKEKKLINEFAVEVLPALTDKELKELARRQAMARSVD